MTVRSGAVPRTMSISGAPGRSAIGRDAGASPTQSTMVGKQSTSETGSRQTTPAGTSGPAMIIGTPADSSYMFDLPHSPRVPRLSPWSLV